VRPEPGAQGAEAGLRAEREWVIDLLKAAFVEGRLTRDELDARIGHALTSRTPAELAAVTADLPAELIGALPRRPPVREHRRIPMNTAVSSGAGVIAAANVAMMGAFLIRSQVAVIVVALLTVVGVILAIAAMIVSR
jgi:hypothetical protein